MSCQHFSLKYNVLFSTSVLSKLKDFVLATKSIKYYHQHSIPFNHFTLDLNSVAYCVIWPCSVSLHCDLENISLKLKIQG